MVFLFLFSRSPISNVDRAVKFEITLLIHTAVLMFAQLINLNRYLSPT